MKILGISIYTALQSLDDLIYPEDLGSCAEIHQYLNTSIPNGIYTISLVGRSVDVYCQFDIENDFAWTLVESFSHFFASTLYSLSFTLGINTRHPTERENVYRLSLKQMTELQDVSTHNLVLSP